MRCLIALICFIFCCQTSFWNRNSQIQGAPKVIVRIQFRGEIKHGGPIVTRQRGIDVGNDFGCCAWVVHIRMSRVQQGRHTGSEQDSRGTRRS